MTQGQLAISLKLIFAEEFFHLLSAFLPKLAILRLCLRVFTKQQYQKATYGIAIVLLHNWLEGYLNGPSRLQTHCL